MVLILILAIVGIQRLLELAKSSQNRKILLSKGGIEHASGHYKWMVCLHAAWFLAILLEVYGLDRSFYGWLFIPALLLTLLGNFLRYSSMRTLGERWNTRIIILPGLKPIRTGLYKYLRHPIYIGVCLEIAFIPLLHTAYLTALLFTGLNLLLLRTRIREEEKALEQA